MSVETHKETLGFQTEVNQLLKLMIHSLYSNKEIFLRELVSNAADAADKLRFEALSDDALYEGDSDLAIDVSYDKAARTLTLRDNGIGMSRGEVVDNIGTIAKSGTRQFFESLTGDQAKDAQLIGQFGVGFYSSFIVADKVTLETRRAGLTKEHGVRWESKGEGDYTLETIEKDTRGTVVTLHLREGEDEFLDGYRLRNIIRTYSDHITLPIRMKKEAMGEENTRDEFETVNKASALWARPKNEITDDEYNEFYKHVAHDFDDPLTWLHSRVEGNQEYTSLLYIPKRAPFDLWDRNSRHGIKLYVRRVFIMDDAEQLMPSYLRFVRGVIDSGNLPLNVSREILQHSKDIDAIRAGSTRKILGMLEKLAKDDTEKYSDFWKSFGKVLKEGIIEDDSNREQLARLLRFSSSHNVDDSETVSLTDYVSRMQDKQDKIYYVTAETWAAAKNSPHLEIFAKKDIEVLLLHDRIDEWLLQHLTEFDGKTLQSVSKGALDLGELEDKEEVKKQEETDKQFSSLVEKIQEALAEQVKAVRITHRLTDSPACLVSEEHDLGTNLERILKEAGQEVPKSKPILEINPEHPMVVRLNAKTDDTEIADWGQILFDQAHLAEGGQLEDPAAYVKRLNKLLLELGE
ncbi:MAG: molecular chaperone HtpG [Acidiferrobacterales bacterium]